MDHATFPAVVPVSPSPRRRPARPADGEPVVKTSPDRRKRTGSAARRSQPSLAVFAPEGNPDGSPTPWLINGWAARIRTWTAEEWATLAVHPLLVQVGANGVRVTLDWDPAADRLRGKLAPG